MPEPLIPEILTPGEVRGVHPVAVPAAVPAPQEAVSGRARELPAGEYHPVEVRGLQKSFGMVEVLGGVDLDIQAGEVVVILGPSGSGKSTLLRCLNLLERPTGGSVRVLGTEITGRRPDLVGLRRRVGMVFQQFNLFPHRTVLQNVMEGPITVLKMDKAAARERAMALLTRVGVAEKADVKPRRLSGGQQQRVAIARALALEPEIMLFDEPTSALDPELRSEVLDVMRSLADEGMTMAVVTHEMDFARRVAHRAVFLDGGRIVEQGDPRAMLAHPESARLQRFLNLVYWHGEPAPIPAEETQPPAS